MLKFTRRFQGSYFTTLNNGCEINIQSYAQFSGCEDKDCSGNTWVLSLDCDYDWEGDHTLRFKSKKAAVAKANEMKQHFEQLTK